MKTKIKRFSKSTVSILLSLMMLFSCVVTSGAVTVQPERTAVTLDDVNEETAVELDSTANADEQTTAQPVALENEKLNADFKKSTSNGAWLYLTGDQNIKSLSGELLGTSRAWKTYTGFQTQYDSNETYPYINIQLKNNMFFKFNNLNKYYGPWNDTALIPNGSSQSFVSTGTTGGAFYLSDSSASSSYKNYRIHLDNSNTSNRTANIKSLYKITTSCNSTYGTAALTTEYSDNSDGTYTYVERGEVVSLVVAANEGYRSSDSYSASVSDGTTTVALSPSGNSFTGNFTISNSTTSDVTLTVTFEQQAAPTYSNTVTVNGATTTMAGIPATAEEGEEISFTPTVPSGCTATVTGTRSDGGDLTITESNGTYSYTMPAANVTINITYSYTVYFYDDALNWETVKVYAWDSGDNPVMVQWPGTALSNPTDKIYTVTLPSTAVGVIFNNINNNSGTQTVDITDVASNKGGTWIIKNSTDGSGHYQGNWGRTVTCNTADNGSVSVTSGYVVNSFARQNGTITLTTAPAEGYYASNVTVTGASGTVVAVTKTAANTYQFTMPDENVTVTPAFAESVTYSSITAKAQYSDNGSAYTDTVQGNVKINGGTVAVTVNAGEYAALNCDKYITINGTKYQFYQWVASASGTFTNASARETNFTPSASNEVATAQYKRLYNITWEPVTGGTISAQTPVMVGENYTVTITPDDGYELTSNSIDGSSRTLTNNAYTAAMPAHDVTVNAEFTKITYNRIYFYDAFEWGYTHIYFWNTIDTSEKNNTGWPGIAMTPDEEYINLYYIDLPSDVSFEKCIFNNITRRYTDNQGHTENIGGQTGEITIGTVSSKNGQVYVPTKYNVGTWSSLSTLINNNTLKKYGDSGYYRIYFYNKNTNLCNLFNDTMANDASSNTEGVTPVYPKARGNTYVQFGKRTNGDTKTVSFYSYDSSAANMSEKRYLYTFAGKAMTPMARSSNYNSGDMFFVDIPVNAEINFVRFARAYPENGKNMTKLYDFNAGQNNNQYFQITNDNSEGDKGIYDTGYDFDHKITGDAYYITEVLMDGSWGDTYQESIPEPEMNDPSSTQARVYAKTGTVRGSYDKYARLAEVSLSYTDGTVISASNKAYYHAYRENGGTTNFYKVEKANIEKNKEFQTTITIKSGYRDKYRVEAFIVNGETVYPSYANESSGIYTCKYTINDKQTTPVEITPVYFYRTAGARPAGQTAYQPSGTLPYDDEFITFYVENFESVKSKWGNTLSCYTWYDNDDEYESQAKSDPTNSTNYVKPTLGGYPGQPMIYRDGSYYTQIPKYNDDPNTSTRKGVMGVTLNNFYWDDIHKNLAGNSEIGGSSGYNCQTYDYDDFTALVDAEGNELDDIIFTFKYNTGGASQTATVGETNDNDCGNKPINYVFENDEVNTSATQTYSLGANGANDGTNTVVASGNKYEVLTDYYGNPITLFGTKITDKTCSQIIDENFTDKLYIVSDGYTTAEHDYIGYFSTKWFVYDNQGTFLGALPPSAFYNASWYTYDNFLKYSVNAGSVYKAGTDGTGYTDAEVAYQTYRTLVGSYNDMPVVICYESDIYGEGRVVKSDGAWRCDGRWFYSKINEKIEASVLIEYSDDNGTTWVRDTPVAGEPYKGSHTTAEAYFTGTGVTGKDVSLTDQDKSNTEKFNFTADLMKLVMRNGEPVIYQFKGWYYTQGADSYKAVEDTVYNPVTESVSGSRLKTSSAVFIARYEPMESADKVRFSHRPYTERLNNYTDQPDVGKGTGNTAISVRILDSTGNPIRIINKTEGIPELLLEELTQANAVYVEVTLYNTNVNEVIGGVYRDTLSSSTGYTIMYGSGTAATPEWVTTGDVKSDLSTSSNELVYIYNTSFFLQDSAIKDNMRIMNYYSNYKIPNSLVITHKLLETVVTDDNMLSTIVDERGNQITPHHDFFNTETKITVKVLDSSDVDVKTFTTTTNQFDLKTADLVNNGTDYKTNGYKLQIILEAATNGEEFQPERVTGDALAQQFGFYNYRDSKYNHYTEKLLSDKGNAATPTYASDSNIHTYTYTYTIPITDLYDNTTNDFVVGSLDFFSDPFKRITAEVKYYDRDVSADSHSKPTDINKTATTVHISYDVSYKNTIAGFNSEAISPKFSEINNILDEHCYWITQSAAIAGIGNTKDFHNSTDKSTSTTDAGVRKYNEDQSADLSYHTDYYGRAKGTSHYAKLKDSEGNFTVDDSNFEEAKWVTYKDSSKHEINVSTESFGFENISSVTIWCYNKPKEYSFTAYYVPPTPNSTEEDVNATTLVLSNGNMKTVTTNGDATYMYIVNPEDEVQFTTQDGKVDSINIEGFYNQRLGIPNNDEEIDGHTEYLAAYGITNPYFGITGCDEEGNAIENKDLTGFEVKAVKYAKDSSDATVNAYEFDGWYIRHESGYQKISSERFYQNRVVSNIVLYAGYRKIPQSESTVGVAVSLNGVDHYVDTDNVRKVRFNTQFNIFGADVKDHDTDIQNVAAIYMTMPTEDASGNAIDWKNDTNNKALRDVLIDQQSAIRTKLQKHQKLLQDQLDYCIGNSVIDSDNKDWYHTYTYPDLATALKIQDITYRTDQPYPFKIDWYAYKVVRENPDKALHEVTLTNKNRIQFYKVFDEETYEKTPIIAYVAVKYKDNWYISDNFVSNITYKTNNDEEIYFPDYVEGSTGVYSNLETPFTEFLNQDMFKRSYEDEIGLEDNGVYIDFTNDYEEEELPLDVLLE